MQTILSRIFVLLFWLLVGAMEQPRDRAPRSKMTASPLLPSWGSTATTEKKRMATRSSRKKPIQGVARNDYIRFRRVLQVICQRNKQSNSECLFTHDDPSIEY